MRRLIKVRKACPEIGTGDWQVLESGNPSVLVHAYTQPFGHLVLLHNLSSDAREAALDLPGDGPLTSLLGGADLTRVDGRVRLRLEGYGYRWTRAAKPRDPASDQ